MKKRNLLILTAASVLVMTAGAASAQPYPGGPPRAESPGPMRWDGDRHWRDDRGGWMSINQRQAQLDARIDQGVRNGSLTRREAQGLRSQFRDIARLEQRYRAGGLSDRERADLDRRFDRLAAQIRYEKRDNDHYGRH
jgi:hypothetical protein